LSESSVSKKAQLIAYIEHSKRKRNVMEEKESEIEVKFIGLLLLLLTISSGFGNSQPAENEEK
jgi:hypothetical protein